MNRVVYLHLETPPRAIMRALDGESDEALARRCLAKWPMLPVTHLTVEDTPLMELLTPAPAPPKKLKPPKQPLTPGQEAWRERKKRQALAERYRQHWIAKDEQKRGTKKDPPPQSSS